MSDELDVPPLNVFYWFYPYPHIEVLRDFVRGELIGERRTDFFSMLKMYPIAFFVTDSIEFKGLPNLSELSSSSIDGTNNITLDISKEGIYSSDWPTLVDNHTYVMAGQSSKSAIVSSPKKGINIERINQDD